RVLAAPEGGWIGALGGDGRPAGLPAMVAAGLPVIRNSTGRLVAGPGREDGFRVEFSPAAGPIA
ncbi:MAG TPA: hypothetical protein VIL69_01095, partial [Roseomonas sp.]